MPDYRARLTATVANVPWQRLFARAVVLIGALVGVLSVEVTGGQPNWLVAFLVVGLAVLAGARPDSLLGALVVALIILHWYVAAGPAALSWAVAPAFCLLVVHAGLAALAVTPPVCFLPRRSVLRWAADAIVVAVATGVVAAVSRYLASVAPNGQQLVTVLGFTALVVTALVVGQRLLVRAP